MLSKLNSIFSKLPFNNNKSLYSALLLLILQNFVNPNVDPSKVNDAITLSVDLLNALGALGLGIGGLHKAIKGLDK